MPDPILILQAMGIAFAMALIAAFPASRLGRKALPAGLALAAGMSLLAGGYFLGLGPRVPPAEVLDRLLVVLLPVAILVEVIAALLGRAPRFAWSLRLLVAVAAAPVLLYGSSYISDSAGPGTREWPGAQLWLILTALAAALLMTWLLLDRLAQRQAGRTVLLMLALASAGTGITVMLSGYATGGQLGLPLAAGLTGVAVGTLLLSGPDVRGAIGVGVVGLFGLVLAGRYFGNLSTVHAVLLLFAPLAGWLAELPSPRLGPRLRSTARLALAAVPVAVVLMLAMQNFKQQTQSPSAGPSATEGSVDDYLNFGK